MAPSTEARLAGVTNIMTNDIGGTSADISTIAGGTLRIKNPRDTVVGGHAVDGPDDGRRWLLDRLA